jgi:hypothetical protein
MPSCCYTDEYGELFSDRTARRTARRFARKGLRGGAKRLADAIAATGIEGATILEVGGGVGDVQADLLRRGAARATNIELSPNWEAAAGRLFAELGLGGRVHRRVGDFVDAEDDLPDADIVILHRVICCYPDWRSMVAATTTKAGRVVGLTLPVDHAGTRLGVRLGNWLLRLQRRSFRAYVHPPEAVLAALVEDGFHPVVDHRGLVWRMLVVRRDASSSSARSPRSFGRAKPSA